MSLNTPDHTDEALMGRVQADDAEAFAELYDRHAVRAFRVARSICREMSQAEDAVQEGFLAVWRSRAHYRPELGSFQAWSMKVVKNRAIDSIRSSNGHRRARLAVLNGKASDVVSAPPDDEVIDRSEGHALRGSLQQLPEAQAEVITMAFFGGLSHSEIATQLQLPQGTVKSRMRLGLEKLRRDLAVSR